MGEIYMIIGGFGGIGVIVVCEMLVEGVNVVL